MIASSLAGLASHLYTTLTLQAQTVAAVQTLFTYEQYLQGFLSYAVAAVAHDSALQKEIAHQEKVSRRADMWDDAKNGFIVGDLVYRHMPSGYMIEIKLMRQGTFCGGIRAHIIKQEDGQKNIYSCVAIETF